MPFYFTAKRIGNAYISGAPTRSRTAKIRHEQTSAARSQPQETTVLIPHVIERIRAYMRYRASVRALSALSERELADIGVTRGSIPAIAKSACQI